MMGSDGVDMGPILPHPDMITVKDKIIIHLLNYSPDRYLGAGWESDPEIISSMPLDITQEGIAKAVGIKWTHVSRAIKEFETHDIVISKKANIQGVEKRRNVYFLNDKGIVIGNTRRDQISSMDVEAVQAGEKTNTTIGTLYPRDEGRFTFLDLIRDLTVPSEDSINVDRVIEFTQRLEAEKELPFVVRTEGLTTPRHFFGRGDELKAIDDIMKSQSRVIVVQGIAGIGKSTLSYRLVNDLSSKSNVYYYQFHEWDTYRAVLTPLTEFLHQLGRDNLRRYLKSKKKLSSVEEEHIAIDLYDIFELVSKDFQDLDGLLIFDDIHVIQGKMDAMLSLFMEVFERANGPKIMVLTRSIPAFYTTKDIVSNRVRELRLMGLDIEGTKELLEAKGLGIDHLEKIHETTGGHPLSLELMRDPYDLVKPSELRRFIQREILSTLSMEERTFLGKIAIFRIPVLPEAFIQTTSEYDTLERLINQIMVEEITYSGYKVNDLIREFIFRTLPKEEQSDLHLTAAKYFIETGGDEAILEGIYHFKEGHDYQKAAELAVENGWNLILRGYLEDLRGVLDIDVEDVPRKLRADFMLLRADIEMALNNWEKAFDWYKEAIKWAGKQNKKVEASALKNIGKIYYERAAWDDALMNFKKAIEISIDLNEHIILGDAYRCMGNVYWRIGKPTKATEYFELAFDHAKKSNDIQLESEIYIDKANNIRHTEKEEAIKLYNIAIENFTKIGYQYGLARVYNNLGAVHYNAEMFTEALGYWEEAITIAEDSGNVKLKAWALFNSSDVLTSRKEFEKAWQALSESREILEKIGDKVGLAYVGVESAVFKSIEKDWITSEKLFEETIKEITDLNVPALLAEAHYQYGQMCISKGDIDKGIILIQTAIKLYQDLEKQPLAEKLQGEIRELKEKYQLD